jgi:hypothetical protein
MRRRTITAIAAGAWLVCAPAGGQTSSAPDLFRAGPDTYAPRYDPSQQQPPDPHPVLPYSVVIDEPAPRRARQSASSGAQQGTAASRGYLSLFVLPVTAQIYVDGFFVGTIEDYRGSPGPLVKSGPHRVELRAEGYETAAFDVRVVAGGVVTHRADLVRAGTGGTPPAPVSAAPAARASERPFYVIPRCYAGDTPPMVAQLPAGCDAADVRIVPGSGVGDRGSGIATPQRRERGR